jgi:hypothetical protein
LDYQLFCEEAWDKILSWYNLLEGQVGIHVEIPYIVAVNFIGGGN